MAYAYPAPRTGTAQDLMRVVTRAYEDRLAREGVVLPVKTEFQRRFFEPFARVVGIALACVMEIVPADWTVAFHNKIFLAVSDGRSYPFEPASPAIRAARELCVRLGREAGLEPALLAAISHPPVMGELAHLNFELVRHAILALREVRGRSCRPRLVVAVDPFALDALNIVEEGVYAGYMGSFHIGLDRLALGRGHPGPLLSPQTRWDRMPFRLLKSLVEGREVGIVLAGGVTDTSRVLYGIREWTRRARDVGALRSRPTDVLRRLRADAAFSRFETVLAQPLSLPHGSWRLLEGWLMAAAAGLLPGQTVESAARAALSGLEVPEAERTLLLEELGRAMSRETPSRRRLFRLLVGRASRRRPLVLIPVIHRVEPMGVEERVAWGVTWSGRGRVRVARAGADGAEEMTAEELAERFTEENFS